MTFAYLIPAFTAAVLGGMTSLPGAFLGGVIIGVVEAVAVERADLRRHPGQRRGRCIVFIVLLAVLVIRPQGLLGKAS